MHHRHSIMAWLLVAFAVCLHIGVASAQVPPEAPGFPGITHWINSQPLTMRKLRGKVVLVDFWAYSCINCLRTLPYVTRWYDEYKGKGFVVVGVHTPEFGFEKDTANVARAVRHFGIHYPVAQDNRAITWRAWNNEYWPAEYLIDRNGRIVRQHAGEGHYAGMENAIRALLGLGATRASDPGPPAIASPEMQFGMGRLRNLANAAGPSRVGRSYHAPRHVVLNHVALQGRWRMTDEYATLFGDRGEIHLRFNAGKVYVVASSAVPVTLSITVDGKAQPSVTVQASKLYTVFDSNDYREHTLVLRVSGRGFRIFSFTFG